MLVIKFINIILWIIHIRYILLVWYVHTLQYLKITEVDITNTI